MSPTLLALVLILAVGALLRVYGMNWDQGVYLHPDERFIAMVSSDRIDMPRAGDFSSIFDAERSPLNPRRIDPNTGEPLSFAYGTLPLYVQSVVSWSINQFSDADYQSYAHLYKVGRWLTVIVDMVTLVTVFALGRRLFGEGAGLIGAALYSFAVLPIQLTHFFTVDVWLTAFVTLTLYAAVRFYDEPTLKRAILLGIPVGCAFATKASVPSLLVPLAVLAFALWRHAETRQHTLGLLAGAGIVSILAFTLFEPYALINSGPLFEDIGLQADIVRGHFDVPYTRQFIGLIPGVYELRNMLLFTMGPGLVLASIAGVWFAVRRAWSSRSWALIIALSWLPAYIPTTLTTEARFLRYTLPLFPLLAVLAGAWLMSVRMRSRPAWLGTAIVSAVLIVTAVWGLGYSTIYNHENSRIAASKWMHANVPAGSVITGEGWDDPLPIPYPNANWVPYNIVTFNVYDDQPPGEKARYIAETLANADYVVLSSDRVRLSIDNLPWRYAVQIEYYERLLAGQLGYQQVLDVETRPGLLGLQLDDTSADESLTVYDHPHVRIFQNVERFSADQLVERFAWSVAQPWEPQRAPARKTLMLPTPVSQISTIAHVDWNGFGQRVPLLGVLAWLVMVELVGLAVMPLVALALRRSPERGAFSGRLIGLLFVSWITWLLASLELAAPTPLTTAVVVLAVAIGSWGWLRRHARETDRTLSSYLPTRCWYLRAGVIWVAVFGFFLGLRAWYPDFWQTWFGGEKPFELAYLRAVTATTTFPSYDPWFSDGIMNYYYYGWHLAATLIKLSGVGVDLGFQLATATFAGLLAVQLVGIGVIAMGKRRSARPRREHLLTGAAVLLGVLFIGNLDAFVQVVQNRSLRPSLFDFWRSRSVIEFTINEFPYFSEIWADLHPHVMNMPAIVLLLTLLAYRLVWKPIEGQETFHLSAFTMLALGTVAVTNAWDAPLLFLTTAAVFVYLALRGRGPTWHLPATAAIVVAGALLMFAPFYQRFYSVVEGIGRASHGSPLKEWIAFWGLFLAVIIVAFGVGAMRRITAPRAVQDGLGLFVVVLAAGTIGQLLGYLRSETFASATTVVALLATGFVVGLAVMNVDLARMPRIPVAIVVMIAVLAGLIVVQRPAASVALGVVAAGAAMALRNFRKPRLMLPWALIIVGFGCLASLEFVYIADDLRNSDWERMNTVFKFSLQAWFVIGIGCAILAAKMAVDSWQSLRSRHNMSRLLASGTLTVLSVVLVLGLLYPALGTPSRLRWKMDSTPTRLSLDGYAWMDGGSITNHNGDVIGFTGDLKAIEWLRDNVDGTPVILEAAIGPYRGNGARISSATGLPAVMGWDRHQRQQRYLPEIDQRQQEVRAIYDTTDQRTKLAMLRKYRVEYVIVGDVERYWNMDERPIPYADPAGLDTFDEMVGTSLELVFDQDGTRIYRVTDFPRLAPATGYRLST